MWESHYFPPARLYLSYKHSEDSKVKLEPWQHQTTALLGKIRGKRGIKAKKEGQKGGGGIMATGSLKFLYQIFNFIHCSVQHCKENRGVGLHSGPLKANELWSSSSRELEAITEKTNTDHWPGTHTLWPRHLCPFTKHFRPLNT